MAVVRLQTQAVVAALPPAVLILKRMRQVQSLGSVAAVLVPMRQGLAWTALLTLSVTPVAVHVSLAVLALVFPMQTRALIVFVTVISVAVLLVAVILSVTSVEVRLVMRSSVPVSVVVRQEGKAEEQRNRQRVRS